MIKSKIKKKGNSSLYKKSLLIFTGVMIILSIICLVYVYVVLKKYESNQVDNYIKNTIWDMDNKTLKGYLSDYSLSADLVDAYKDMVKSKNLEVKQVEENKEYEVYLNDRKLFNINLNVTGEEVKFGLLHYNLWEVESIKPNLERGLVYYDIVVPSNYTVYVDDKLLEKYSKEEKYADMDYMYLSEDMPNLVTYELNNLDKEKNIVIKNFLDEEVSVNKKNFLYTVDNNLKYDNYDEAKDAIDGEVDIDGIAKDWSKFLTRDLTGAMYGFSEFRKNLIKDSELYKYAYKWATGVDITFTSRHTLGNPPFTNESISDFTVYDKNAFSCKVYLDKHMIVAGKEQIDTLHDYLYFIKKDGSWKLVNLQAVTE